VAASGGASSDRIATGPGGLRDAITRAQVQPQRGAQFEPPKIWLQLASGSNPTALPEQFERIKSKDRELFDGIPGYIAKSPDRARLVVGPFRSTTDADTFAQDLESVSITAFKWTNSPSDQIVPLAAE
jgi:hypothetical protein